MSNWPNVTLVYPPNELDESVSKGVRIAANELTRQGVPQEILGGRYRAADAITHLFVNQKNLLRFGRALSSSMCMDVANGSIVTLTSDSKTRFVNSSLANFVQTAAVVTARFPFYDESAADETIDRAVDEVTCAIRSVEESALERDGFWATLVDDIQMGDFATERLVSQHEG
jgi:hypothetical protein